MFSGINWWEFIKQVIVESFWAILGLIKLFFIFAWSVWPVTLLIIILYIILFLKLRHKYARSHQTRAKNF